MKPRPNPRLPWRILAPALLVWPLAVGLARESAVPAPPPATEAAEQADVPPARDFLRFTENDDRAALESAEVVYRNEAGAEVHLIGAVHIGDKTYYDALNADFREFEALLFELVASRHQLKRLKAARGKRKVTLGSGDSAIGNLQRMMQKALGLEFQLDHIDYAAANFVHADLDAEAFRKLQEDRGENFLTLLGKSIKMEKMRRERGNVKSLTLFDLVRILRSKDSPTDLKLALGEQFQDIEELIGGIEGQEGSVLLTERNKAAARVLKKSIDGGKKSIGLFYGAAHLPGIEEILVRDLGFTHAETKWRTAWDIPK